jgi:hypothetical protein
VLQGATSKAGVEAAAQAADLVLVVASSEAPKSRDRLLFGVMEENRALREQVKVSFPFT